MGKRSGGKRQRRNPYVLSNGRLEEDEDEEEALSSMLHQFRGKIELDKMRNLKRKIEDVCEDGGSTEEDAADTSDSDEDQEKNVDGIDMGTRACWGRNKARYYVGGNEKDYEPEELVAAIREAEKFDPPRAVNGLQWLSNFYPNLSKHRGSSNVDDNDDNDSMWSLHSSDLDWSDSESKKEVKRDDKIVAVTTVQPAGSTDDDSEDEETLRRMENDSETNDRQDELVRRPITREMEANRGIIPKRKKEQRNPRVKHRNKYRKALIKHHSQIPKVRKEVQRYSGEINGIRCGILRSRKFR